MRADRRVRVRGLRGGLLAAIVAAGLVSLVGSGGGFPPCGAPWCDDGPYVPPATASVSPPYVTAQVGSAVGFRALASGFSGTLSYQWSRSSDGTNFTDIPGASAVSLTLPAVNLADDATVYRVQVRTSTGQSQSALGRLLVNISPGIVLNDGDFTSGRWSAFPRANPPGVLPAHSAIFESSGGVPGAWLNLLFQIPPGAGSAAVVYLRSDAQYDPRTQGAIRVIDYAEDCRTIVASDLRYAESHIVFEQAGRRYSAINSNVCKSTAWSADASRASFGSADFTRIDGPACGAGESCPDFSPGGLPLTFGFRRFVWGAPGDSIGHGIDNWKVTVWRR
jgi:hypothetical protein